MMIGVCLCIKKDIASLETTYCSSSSATNNDVTKTPTIGAKRASSTSMRSLSTTSGLSASKSFSENRTPQKKDSVVSRTLDYVFGW